jgi:hypothetical protein
LIPSRPDVALRAIGAALAAVSIAFAINMLVYGDGKVRVVGMQHLAIFAQPRGTPPVAAPSPAEPPASESAVDMAAIGSFAERAPSGPPPSRPELVAARPGRAWLRIGGAIIAAEPGQDVAGLGRVGGILERDGEWRVIDDKGAVLLTLRHDANAAGLFLRKLIFD